MTCVVLDGSTARVLAAEGAKLRRALRGRIRKMHTISAAAAAALVACSPTVPGYGTQASILDCPWPADDIASVYDQIAQGWPLVLAGVHAPDVTDALLVPEVVCATQEADYPNPNAHVEGQYQRIAGRYLADGPLGVPRLELAGGYDTARESSLAQEAIHHVLAWTGGDPYVTEAGEDVEGDDVALRDALWALEEAVRAN